MTIQELAALIGGTLQTKTVDTSREVTCGYCCDLLSWVMAKGKEGMAWATVQAHMNAVAVAVLADMSCVIAAEGVQFAAEMCIRDSTAPAPRKARSARSAPAASTAGRPSRARYSVCPAASEKGPSYRSAG